MHKKSRKDIVLQKASTPDNLSSFIVEKILVLEINSSINPATYNYLQSAYQEAKNKNFSMLLIRLNTPGGLVSTTKKIITLIGASDIPVVVWVGPEGASATSAGAIIASSAHILVMNQGTNIGAATPVQMGSQDIAKDMRAKAINDLVALIKSLAKTRGRNPEAFATMIEKASSYSADQALAENLIDSITNDYNDLKNVISGRIIQIKGKNKQLTNKNPRFVPFAMDSGQKLNIFADPSMAYVLFVVGAALLYLEFQTGGAMIAGALGLICLLLAGIGFQVLPLNAGALILMFLSFVLLY